MRTERRLGLGFNTVVAAGGLVAATVLLAACGGDEPAVAENEASPGAAFRSAVETKDLAALQATFADDIQLYSPVLPDPFIGKAKVDLLFGVLVDTFQDIEIVDEYESANGGYVLSFHARVGAEPIHIVDLLRFDAEGKVVEFVVTARAVPGIQALAAAVAPHLPAILSAK